MSMNPIKNARQRRCRQTRRLMSEYIDGELGPEMRALDAHLARCPNCRRMLQNLSRTTTALQAVGGEQRSLGLDHPHT